MVTVTIFQKTEMVTVTHFAVAQRGVASPPSTITGSTSPAPPARSAPRPSGC